MQDYRNPAYLRTMHLIENFDPDAVPPYAPPEHGGDTHITGLSDISTQLAHTNALLYNILTEGGL